MWQDGEKKVIFSSNAVKCAYHYLSLPLQRGGDTENTPSALLSVLVRTELTHAGKAGGAHIQYNRAKRERDLKCTYT